MGTTVYDSEIAIKEGAHVFCHSRKDGKDGCVYLIINNSLKSKTTVNLPKMEGVEVSGTIKLALGTCTFLVM